MARRRSTHGIDSRLSEIVSNHVNELVSALSQEIRKNVADEVSAYFGGGEGRTVATRRLGAGRPKKKRILQCIAPGCTNQSKGPRFHYLCDKHMTAPKKDYEAWRKAKKEKAA